MSKRLSFYIFCSSQIALAHQPVHVRITLNILLISIGVKQRYMFFTLVVLLDFPILPKNALIFNVGLQRYVLFHLEIIGVQQKLSTWLPD